MLEKIYCENCNDKVSYSIRRQIIREYKGYEVGVIEEIGVCNICKNDLYIPELESKNFENLYATYRKLADLIKPEEIIKLRTYYDISQEDLGQILNWRISTIGRYEKGVIPTKEHNDFLKLIVFNMDIFQEIANKAFQDCKIEKALYEKVRDR